MESRSCVVVGAGISGLMCAKVLREKGFSVTVLEGRSRIGGRIHTDEHFCDLGASWIHGEVGNPLMKFEVESMASPSGGHSVACFDARGKRYSVTAGGVGLLCCDSDPV
jgi:phytoene dehydrogenase-like protein